MSDIYKKQAAAFAKKHLIGHHIVNVGYADRESVDLMGYDESPLIITLSNGMQLMPLMDPEGNGPGAIDCGDENGNSFLYGPI